MKKALVLLLSLTLVASILVFPAAAVESYDDAYTFNFEDMTTGYNLLTPYSNGNTFRTIWTPTDGQGAEQTDNTVVEDGGNKYASFNGFTEVPCDYTINEPYTFGADIKGTAVDWMGVFVRSSKVDFKSSTADAKLGWFGWDGADYTGSSGIFTCAKSADGKSTLSIGIKTYDHKSDKEWVGNLVYTAAAPDGVDLNGFNTYEFADDNVGTIAFKIGGKLFATIKYSALGSYDGYTEKYYKTAKILDASGAEVGSTDAALICETSTVVLYTRNATLNIDNLYFRANGTSAPVTPTVEKYITLGLTVDETGDSNNVEYSVKDGHLFLKSTGADPYVTLTNVADAGVTCADYPYVALRLKGGNGKDAHFYYGTDQFSGPLYNGAEVIAKFTYADGADWQNLVVNMSELEYYKGSLNYFRYDFFAANEEYQIELAGIGFFKTAAQAAAWDGSAYTESNPGTSDAAVVVIATVAAIALAGVVVCKKVKA